MEKALIYVGSSISDEACFLCVYDEITLQDMSICCMVQVKNHNPQLHLKPLWPILLFLHNFWVFLCELSLDNVSDSLSLVFDRWINYIAHSTVGV